MATITMTAPDSELGRAVRDVIAAPAGDEDPRTVLLDLSAQSPNALLHDGKAWKRHGPDRILAGARDALASDADFVVRASYAFLHAVDDGAPVGDRLRPIVDAARRAEELVLTGERPACVVRLGYRYGPESRDLAAYRRAFRIGRPYWAGPQDRLQHHLHSADAARALLLAAQTAAPGTLSYATDAEPASFAAFMDHFARLVGNPRPLHIPRLAGPIVRPVVAVEHQQMVDLGVRGPAAPPLAGAAPEFPSYREGLVAVVSAWGGRPVGRG